MDHYEATIVWQRGAQPFVDKRYSRAHEWVFDGGTRVSASSSPLSVPVPMSNPDNVDPEEALVAAVSSCHMLFFLSIAAKDGFIVDQYTDHALGFMAKNSEGKIAMTRIALRPRVVFSGAHRPAPQDLAEMHDQSHDACYIANSLKTEVVVELV